MGIIGKELLYHIKTTRYFTLGLYSHTAPCNSCTTIPSAMPYSYGIDRFARALAAIPADSDTHTWILASSDFNQSQVHAANFDDADGHIKCTGQFSWDHEVTDMTVAATRPWIAAAAGTNTSTCLPACLVIGHLVHTHSLCPCPWSSQSTCMMEKL